jgi:MFS family permease
MLNLVDPNERVGYSNIWTVCTSLALGVTPVLAGQAIEWGGIWGFRLCFIMSGVGGLFCAALVHRIVRDDTAQDVFNPKLHGLKLPFIMVGEMIRISTGRHESNR